MPCTAAATSLNAFLGVTGDIQMDGVARCAVRECAKVPMQQRVTRATPPRSNNLVGCQANAQVVMHTGFTQAECANFATLYNALSAASPSVPAPLLCTSSGCNALVDAVASPAARAAAGAAALAALAAAAALM